MPLPKRKAVSSICATQKRKPAERVTTTIITFFLLRKKRSPPGEGFEDILSNAAANRTKKPIENHFSMGFWRAILDSNQWPHA